MRFELKHTPSNTNNRIQKQVPQNVDTNKVTHEHKPGCMFPLELAKNFNYSCIGGYEGMRLYAKLAQSDISKLPELTLNTGHVTIHTVFEYCPECGVKL